MDNSDRVEWYIVTTLIKEENLEGEDTGKPIKFPFDGMVPVFNTRDRAEKWRDSRGKSAKVLKLIKRR